MAVNKINVAKLNDVPWTYSAKASEQRAVSTIKYKDDFDGWASRCPEFGDAHPDFSEMLLTEIKADREPGDQIAVVLTYETSLTTAETPGRPTGGGVIYRYAAEISDGEEHILSASIYGDNLSRKEITALMAISNGMVQKDEGGLWQDDITSALGLQAFGKIDKGYISRKSYGLFWVERYTTDDLADIDFSNILHTQSPPGGIGGTSTQWLYIGATATETADGGTYDLERRWQYSPDAWDSDLYPAAT